MHATTHTFHRLAVYYTSNHDHRAYLSLLCLALVPPHVIRCLIRTGGGGGGDGGMSSSLGKHVARTLKIIPKWFYCYTFLWLFIAHANVNKQAADTHCRIHASQLSHGWGSVPFIGLAHKQLKPVTQRSSHDLTLSVYHVLCNFYGYSRTIRNNDFYYRSGTYARSLTCNLTEQRVGVRGMRTVLWLVQCTWRSPDTFNLK